MEPMASSLVRTGGLTAAELLVRVPWWYCDHYQVEPPAVWVADWQLRCRKCAEYSTARCAVRTLMELRQQLDAGKLSCQCGGPLTTSLSGIILV